MRRSPLPRPHVRPPVASFRFYEELNDFLPRERRKVAFGVPFRAGDTVGAVIRALGVDTEAVDLVLVDGRSSGLSHTLRDGDRVSVYPVFESFDVGAVSKVRRRPLREVRFLVERRFAGLAPLLRVLGFDAAVGDPSDLDAFLDRALRDRRVVLASTPAVLGHPTLQRGLRLTQAKPRPQLLEVLRRLDLKATVAPFTRCPRCNGPFAWGRMEPISGPLRCPQCRWAAPGPGREGRIRQIVDGLLAGAMKSR